MKRVAVLLALALCTTSEPLADSTIHTEEQCLASAIFYEARGETAAGRRAVLDVIQHRMREYGKTACQVVKQRGQFSWSGSKPIKRYTSDMREMLTKVREHPKVLINERFKWFFSRKIVTPKWARNLHCEKIGNHKFCKER